MGGYRPGQKDVARDQFNSATLARLMARMTTPEQIGEARKIIDDTQRAREREAANYNDHYEVRVRQMVAKVRQERTAPKQEYKPIWSRIDQLNAADIKRLAEKRVRKAHEQVMSQLHEQKVQALARLAGAPPHEVAEQFKDDHARLRAEARARRIEPNPDAMTRSFNDKAQRQSPMRSSFHRARDR